MRRSIDHIFEIVIRAIIEVRFFIPIQTPKISKLKLETNKQKRWAMRTEYYQIKNTKTSEQTAGKNRKYFRIGTFSATQLVF